MMFDVSLVLTESGQFAFNALLGDVGQHAPGHIPNSQMEFFWRFYNSPSVEQLSSGTTARLWKKQYWSELAIPRRMLEAVLGNISPREFHFLAIDAHLNQILQSGHLHLTQPLPLARIWSKLEH